MFYAVALLKCGRKIYLKDEETYLRIVQILLTKKTDCNAVFKVKQ